MSDRIKKQTNKNKLYFFQAIVLAMKLKKKKEKKSKEKPVFSSDLSAAVNARKAATPQQQQQQQVWQRVLGLLQPCSPSLLTSADSCWRRETTSGRRGHNPDFLLSWQQDDTSAVVYPNLVTVVYPQPAPPSLPPHFHAIVLNFFFYCLKHYILIRNTFHKVHFALNFDLLRCHCLFSRI